MARRPKHEPLNVFLNARLVGKLRREASRAGPVDQPALRDRPHRFQDRRPGRYHKQE